MYIQTGYVHVYDARLHAADHLSTLVVSHKVLHHDGRDRCQTVTQNIRLQALQKCAPGDPVHGKLVINVSEQYVTEPAADGRTGVLLIAIETHKWS